MQKSVIIVFLFFCTSLSAKTTDSLTFKQRLAKRTWKLELTMYQIEKIDLRNAYLVETTNYSPDQYRIILHLDQNSGTLELVHGNTFSHTFALGFSVKSAYSLSLGHSFSNSYWKEEIGGSEGYSYKIRFYNRNSNSFMLIRSNLNKLFKKDAQNNSFSLNVRLNYLRNMYFLEYNSQFRSRPLNSLKFFGSEDYSITQYHSTSMNCQLLPTFRTKLFTSSLQLEIFAAINIAGFYLKEPKMTSTGFGASYQENQPGVKNYKSVYNEERKMVNYSKNTIKSVEYYSKANYLFASVGASLIFHL